jgi:glycosyltransferase involved in cell wall biosynthesis
MGSAQNGLLQSERSLISKSSSRRVDIVIPLFNEEEVVRQLHRRVVETAQKLPFNWRIVYVDDGSTDQTIARLLAILGDDENVELIQLSRNFGQAAAIHAGLKAADGDAVVLMDGDLQDPPELIAELVDHWTMGYEVVIARRTGREEETWFRKFSFNLFHRLFKRLTDLRIPENCGTYCLLDGRAAKAIAAMPETHRFFPGLRAWVGFDQGFVDYARPKRAAGAPKQSFWRLVDYAMDGILGYSRKPAKWLIACGGVQICVGLLLGLLAASLWIANVFASSVPWMFTFGVLAFLSGIQLLGMGMLAELAFRIYDQSKDRPNYFISRQITLKQTPEIKSLRGPAPKAEPQLKAG